MIHQPGWTPRRVCESCKKKRRQETNRINSLKRYHMKKDSTSRRRGVSFKANVIFGVLLVSASLLLLYTVPPAAEAAITLGSHSVGISLSKTCLTMQENHIPNNCPTYEDLISLDTSDRKYSGDFVKKPNGLYYRETPKLKSSWMIYQFDGRDQYRIFVDPPKGYAERIPMIIIESNFDLYKLNNDHNVKNYTVIQYEDRWTDKRCKQTIVNSEKWLKLVGDSIYFMRNKCNPIFTTFDPKITFEIPLESHDISSSYKWKLEQWQKYIRTNCLHDYSKCKDLPVPGMGPWIAP
jgi:hypothetical protein